MSIFIESKETVFIDAIRKAPPLRIEGGRVSVDLDALDDLISGQADLPEGARQSIRRRFARVAAPIIATTMEATGDSLIMAFPEDTPKLSSFHYIADMVRWTALRESIKSSGVDLVDLPIDRKDSMYLLWMRDPCIIIDDCAFFSDTGALEKRGNMTHKVGSITNAKMKMESMGLRATKVEDSFFAGGNIIFDDQTRTMFYGEDNNINIDGGMDRLVQAIEENTGRTYRPVFVPNDRFSSYHIDLGCSEMLPDGRYLVAENLGPNRDGSGRAVLEEILGKDRVIRVDARHADMVVPNLAVAGNGVFMTACPDDLREHLEEKGIRVNAPRKEDLSGTCFALADEFSAVRALGTGGVHCMTNKVATRHLKKAADQEGLIFQPDARQMAPS